MEVDPIRDAENAIRHRLIRDGDVDRETVFTWVASEAHRLAGKLQKRGRDGRPNGS
jgi:hypothetical protein